MNEASPPPRIRFSFQFSLGTLFWLMLTCGFILGWWNERRRMEQRLTELETRLFPPQATLWSTDELLGPPDEPTGTGGKAWCPALADQGEQWVLLEYPATVTVAQVVIHETYSTGAVSKVAFVDSRDNETVIWQGIDPVAPGLSQGVATIPVPRAPKAKRVKIYLNTNVAGWNCLDTVGLVDTRGKSSWPKEATASSSYGRARAKL